MKRWSTFLAPLIILSVLAAGCGDDDCPACPQQTTPLGFVEGALILEMAFEKLYARTWHMHIHGRGGVPPNIDSMKIGDSLLHGDDFFEYSPGDGYARGFWKVNFAEGGDDPMYEHGDTAVVRFYADGRTSTCRLKILDFSWADASITSPAPALTITPTDTVTAHWHIANGADYYAISLQFVTGDAYERSYEFSYSTDTTFVVTPDKYPDSLRYFYICITPFTGADPGTGASNVTGDYLTGSIWSFGEYDETQVIGWYPPAGSGSAGLTADEPDRRAPSAAEMVAKVYERFK